MSVFSPVDVRGPAQRHKQLLQKVLAQGQVSHTGALPMPSVARTAALLAAQGHGKRTAPGNVTQASNILPSILAKLGIAGRSLPSEVSPGAGLPIAPPRPMPIAGPPTPPAPPIPFAPAAPQAGAPVNTPAPAAAAPALVDVAPAPADVAAPTTPVQLGSGAPTDAAVVSGPGPLPQSSGNVFTTTDTSGAPTGPPLVDPGFLMTSSAPVPLGNGLYYDPATGMVLGQQADTAGTAARAVAGRAVAV